MKSRDIMKSRDGRFCQRVGALIEKRICETYKLFYNTRQRKKGYYDAHDENTLYEIKATQASGNRILITEKNHRILTELGGRYIFVLYSLKNTDKNLTVMSDIKIERVVFKDAAEVDSLIAKGKATIIKSKAKNKTFIRIRARHVMNGSEGGINNDNQ